MKPIVDLSGLRFLTARREEKAVLYSIARYLPLVTEFTIRVPRKKKRA